LVHERLNDAPPVDSVQFRVILDPNDRAEKLVGAVKDTTICVDTELTEFSPPERDCRVIVYVPAATPEYTATFPVMEGVTPIAGDEVRVNWHPGVAEDQESVAVEPYTLCCKFVGADGVTDALFIFVGTLVTPPHTETSEKLYVPQPRDRLNGEFPILLDDPIAWPDHVRFICDPAVCPDHARVTLLFKLSVEVNVVGFVGATDVAATALYVVKPLSVAPTWKEYVPGVTLYDCGLVVGVNVVPPVLIVNVQLGVDTAQEILMDDVPGVTLICGTAGRNTVIGNSGEDAGPRIPRRRHATVKLSVVDVPGVKTVPLGYGIVAIPLESTEA